MNERAFFDGTLWVMLGLSAITFVSLFFIVAPYGRHARGGWGASLPSRVGWIVMEVPAALGFAAVFLVGERRGDAVPLVLLALWELHYLNRAFVYPFRRRGGDKPMPASVVALGFGFNVVNAYLNARWLSHFARYDVAWLGSARFLGGAALFVVGFAVNQHADEVLRRLRSDGDGGYKIPRGGLYRFVSAPNYLGEILEWTGFALASWSPAGAAFAVWTAANLAPRARANHRWYRQRFADYPTERRALVPFLW